MNIGTLSLDLSVVLSKFHSALDQVRNRISRVGADMEQAFGPGPRREIDKTQDRFQRFTWAVRGYVKDTSKVVTGILISQGFYKMLNTIESATGSLFKFNNQLQQSAIAFDIMLGGEDKAKAFQEMLLDFAADTSYSYEQAQRTAQQLIAYGIPAQATLDTMRKILDAASIRGAGPEVIEGISRALGQMAGKSKIEAQELRQLAEWGIPAYKILQEELHLTAEEVQNIGDLGIPGIKGVIAILEGMDKRFHGASERISRTTGGLIEKIGDNLKVIGNEVFKGVFEAIRLQLEGIADRLTQLKGITRREGLKGLFEELVPPRLRTVVLSAIYGIEELVRSLQMLWQSIKPVVVAMGELALRVAGLVIPILAGLIRVVAKLGEIVYYIPLIRYLAAAIGTLLIAGVVIRVMTLFYGALRLLFIAGPVARVILMLRDAIVALNVAMVRNPFTGLVVLATAALLNLALSSQTASRWLDAVMQRLGLLLGLDIGKALEPTSPQEVNKWMEEYNKSLKDIVGDIQGTGDAASEAGKKVKDKFLASFDEVYEIPEKLGDVGDAIGNVGDNINIPDLPSLPNLEVGTTPEIDTSRTGGMIDSLIKKLQDATKNFPPLIIPPPRFDPPLTVPVENLAAFFERLQIMWAEATAGVREWVRQFGQAFNNALQPVRDWYGELERIFDKVGETVGRGIQTAIDWIILFPARVSGAFNNALQPVRDWYGKVEEVFNKLGETVGRGIQTAIDWVILFPVRVSEAFSEVSTSIGQHIAEAVNWLKQLPAAAWQVLQQAGMVIQPGLQTIAQFFEDHKLAIIGIFAALGVAIVLFFTGLPASIVGAATAFVIFVGSIFTNAKLAAASQLEQTKTEVSSKWEEIKTNIVNKVQEIYDSVVQWFTDLGTSISTKFEEYKTTADTKWEEIKTVISTWVEDTIKTISDKWEGFKTTLRDIWESIRITADEYWSSIKDTIKAQINQIIAFVNKFIDYWNSIEIKVPQVYVPFVGYVGGYTISVPQIPKIPFLAEGGIITRDQIIRVAEDNHPEGVIPLSSSRARPFAEMIADAIATVIPQQTVSSGPSLPPLYVGTLIADDRGIKELYRRMEIIRIQEIQRRGGKP